MNSRTSRIAELDTFRSDFTFNGVKFLPIRVCRVNIRNMVDGVRYFGSITSTSCATVSSYFKIKQLTVTLIDRCCAEVEASGIVRIFTGAIECPE